jgi:cbb3-type cytochrome oxidase subunit 3
VRILGAAVLVFESMVMGFALLLAMDSHGAAALAVGSLLSLSIFLTAGLLKRRSGWILGTCLQIGLIAYGLVVPLMFFLGLLFCGLWAAAYYFGKKGEAIRARLLAERAAAGDSGR